MIRYPEKLSHFFPNYLHVLVIPAFFLLSVLLYEPRALCDLMRTGESDFSSINAYSFNIAIVSAILFVVMHATRLPYWFLRKKLDMTLGWYAVWCILEVFLLSAFVALYLTLMSGEGGYFQFLGKSLSSFSSILVYPYVILALLYCLHDASEAEPLDDSVRLKFYDSRHQLKFITSASSILYFEADENYIILHFLENGEEKKYSLRNTLKSIEPLCAKAGFVRTHRGFIVNPAHVKQVRKEPGGFYFADLGTGREEGIPVSKKYYDALVSAL